MLDIDANRRATRLRIGGEWVAAADGDETQVVDPATGEPIGSVSNANVADGLAAVSAATTTPPVGSRKGADGNRAAGRARAGRRLGA